MKLPWMSLPSTVANLHSFGLECVKQFFNDDCRRWIQQERAKLMQNLMRNDEKSVEKVWRIERFLEGKLVRSENGNVIINSVTINLLYQCLIHLLITISKINMN
jgi:hypothetical protein